MRKLIPVLSLFAVSCGTNAPQIVTPPQVAPEINHPGQVVLQEAPGCPNLAKHIERYQAALRLGDWNVAVSCHLIPDSENAWAISHVAVEHREIAVVIDPRAPDIELTVLHELLHAVMSEVRQADSELTEEQAVRALSEAIIGRSPKGE